MSTVHTPDLQAELARLRQENEALKADKARKLTIKMSDKGCVSLYGMGRFPVSLYPSQWLTVFELQGQITAYLKDNAVELAKRGEATKEATKQAKAA